MSSGALLIAFAGLPGTGKSTLAREAARRLGAVYLRIDSIEGALRPPVTDEGYRAAYAVAEDNLRLGRTVVSDCVNPLNITRAAWRDTARRAGARVVEVEVVCSDAREHRRRVESRARPTWEQVTAREYHGWEGEPLRLDTARWSVEECVRRIEEAVTTSR